VRDVFCLVWASHSGLTEQELLEILQVPPLALSSLLCAGTHYFYFKGDQALLINSISTRIIQS
jgi:hypothetical protein